MAPVLVLLQTVFASILEVFLLCLAGFILAYRGILDKRTQKQLNRLNVSLFTPSLLFSKVAFFLSPAKLRELWIIPIFFVIVTTVSMSVAYILGTAFRLKPSQRSFAMAAAMFMNSNSLPIALMQSLVVTVHGLKWDIDDTKSAMLGRALTYLVLYSTLGMVLRWSYGVHLLSKADPEGSDGPPTEDSERGQNTDYVEPNHEDANENSPLLRKSSGSSSRSGSDDSLHTRVYGSSAPSRSGSGSETLHTRTPSVVLTDVEGDTKAHTYSHEPTQHNGTLTISAPSTNPESAAAVHHHNLKPSEHRVFYSFPNTPTRSAQNLVSAIEGVNYEDLAQRFPQGATSDSASDSSGSSSGDASTPPGFFRRVLHKIGHKIRSFLKTLNEFMTVPLYAAFLSLIVALIPPFQHALNMHVKPIKGALEAAGACSIPVTLVVLGAYFYTPSKEGVKDSGAEAEVVASRSGESSRRGSWIGSVRSLLSLRTIRSKSQGYERFSDDVTQENTRANAGSRPGESMTVVIAVVSRMFLTPLLLLPLMAVSAHYDIPAVFDDPVFIVSNVLLISSPPALTLAQITQAASGDAFERLISRTIFWSYCIVTPPMTIVYVVIGLMFAKL